ncbi:MAG: hypothetical protein Q4B60_09270 [Erysipelotrichaceae bacterium]|nr:hypothetical protein [Erysipelotrichaceae bacterium]
MITAKSVNNTEIFSVTVTSPIPEEASLLANAIAAIFPDKVANIVNGTSAKIVEYGVTNRNKVGPNYTKYALLGAAAGFILSCAVILLLHFLDDTIRSEDQLNNLVKVPVLAVIPNLKETDNKTYESTYKKKGEN